MGETGGGGREVEVKWKGKRGNEEGKKKPGGVRRGRSKMKMGEWKEGGNGKNRVGGRGRRNL